MLRSGTSIASNVEEAEAATTKRNFIYKILIGLREAKETHYWLRLIRDSEMMDAKKLHEIIDEAEQIKKFLALLHRKQDETR